MKKPFRHRNQQPNVLLNSAITFPKVRLIDPNGLGGLIKCVYISNEKLNMKFFNE